eukprot:TRINITY_DN5333_c0_g1_i4.p1 TRINITY_DN5333_c0_g1~~TRINITY_DN5333_c0_g1_i4.p1  ORF type:complete len:279 (+),score=54.45 TRINITY_DN5333_c0_g1_i4:154-990(+)
MVSGARRRQNQEQQNGDAEVQPAPRERWARGSAFMCVVAVVLLAVSWQYQRILEQAPTRDELDGVHLLRGGDGKTGMHKAAAKGVDAVMERMATHPEEVHMEDRTGETPLFIAARSGAHSGVQALLERGNASLLVKNKKGQSVLFVAMAMLEEHNNHETHQVLLKAGADPNATTSRNTESRTLLQWAVQENLKWAVETLHAYNACLDCCGDHGASALHLVAESKDRIDMLELLLSLGADPNVQDTVAVFRTLGCFLMPPSCAGHWSHTVARGSDSAEP